MTEPRRETALSSDLADLAAQARRLLDLVERGDLVADDAAGRRVVNAWQALASGGTPPSVDEAFADTPALNAASDENG